MAGNLPKNNTEYHQNFAGSYKKHGDSGLTPRYREYQKVKKVIIIGKKYQKLSEQHNLQL